MRVTMTVRPEGAHELRAWLRDVPELRGRVLRDTTAEAPPGAMGPAADAVIALLEPGGVAAVFAGALVAWVQTRRQDCTVTVTRPDGTEISIATRRARQLSPQELAELTERLAGPPPGDGRDSGEPGR